VLQIMGALFTGNRPTVHVDQRVCVVTEQFVRMLVEECGLRASDLDLLACKGPVMGSFCELAQPRNTLFTGSSHVAEHLAKTLHGRVRVEDAGFDWKILGPDAPDTATPEGQRELEFVAWTADQDAYACSGQKCSAQSILYVHDNWMRTGLLDRLGALAQRRRLEDLTIGPVITWSTDRMLQHVDALCSIPGAKLLWGGKPLTGHSIPKQ